MATSRERPTLTPKQEMFCLEYVVDMNGTQAAIRAGYSKRTANEQAAQLLAKPSIKQRVQELLAERARRVKLSADWVLARLRAEAERAGDGASPAARVRALELLGKHLGLFPARVEHSGPAGGPIDLHVAATGLNVDPRTLSDDELDRRIAELEGRASPPGDRPGEGGGELVGGEGPPPAG